MANHAANSITVYAPGASGNARPVGTISGADTSISGPVGLTIDPAGHLWVSDNQSNALTEYASGANGDASPLDTISGSNTGLSSPGLLAVAPPLAVHTAQLHAARAGRRYSAQLEAVLGTTPYAWTMTRGRLPHGVHLSRDGKLSGRPEHQGLYRFTVGVRDSSHPRMTATRRLELHVLGR